MNDQSEAGGPAGEPAEVGPPLDHAVPGAMLSGKTALVTGIGPGMGRDIALGLARQGADVALMARSDRNGPGGRRGDRGTGCARGAAAGQHHVC